MGSDGKESACNAGDLGSIPESGRSPGERIGYPLQYSWTSLVAQLVKNPLQCRIPGFDPWIGKIPWRRAWGPSPVFLPGESHAQRSSAGYNPRGHKESDTTEQLSLSLSGLFGPTASGPACFSNLILFLYPLTTPCPPNTLLTYCMNHVPSCLRAFAHAALSARNAFIQMTTCLTPSYCLDLKT